MNVKENSTKLIKIITLGAFFSFFLFGFSDNLKGPTLPVLLEELSFDYGLGATILLLAYLGFLIATLITGPIADIAGKKIIIVLASIFLLVGMLGYSLVSELWALALSMFFMGMGMGALEVGGNLIIVEMRPEDKGRYLNLLAFFHSIGSMVAPLYAGQMLVAGFSWRRVYQFGAVIALLVLVYFLLAKYPRITSTQSNDKVDFKNLGRSLFTGKMLLFFVAITVYVAAEVGIGSWLVEFLQKVKLQSVTKSTFFLALFFGAITAGRFIGSFFLSRFGYIKSVFFASLAASVFVSLGLFGASEFAVLLPLSGLFFSIIFPTLTAAVSDIHQENQGTILGLLFTFAGLGAMLGPWAVGMISDWLGMQQGFSVILFFLLLMNAVLALLFWKGQREMTS